jgi:hypothetical protein
MGLSDRFQVPSSLKNLPGIGDYTIDQKEKNLSNKNQQPGGYTLARGGRGLLEMIDDYKPSPTSYDVN